MKIAFVSANTIPNILFSPSAGGWPFGEEGKKDDDEEVKRKGLDHPGGVEDEEAEDTFDGIDSLHIYYYSLSLLSPDTVAAAEFPSRRIKVSKVSKSKDDAIMYLDV